MALATYSDLQSSVAGWLDRSDMTAIIPDCIALAEARLNRELGPVETNDSLIGIPDSREISISALTLARPVALWIAPSGDDETSLDQIAPGLMRLLADSGFPDVWAIDGTNIMFNRPLDQAYPVRFRYQQHFALSDTATTNWLLTNHPDVYLAASMMWGAGYNENFANGAVWKGLLDEAIPQIQHDIALTRRSTLAVDPALASIGRRPLYSGRFQ